MFIICTLGLQGNLSPAIKTDDGGMIEPGIPVASEYGAYFNNIAISPATPVSNYQVRVDLDSRFNYSRCQPAGQDIRFFDASNNSLPYWIEKWNDRGKSTIWIKVLLTGTSSIVLRYGNASASPVSNGDSVFLLFDDFSSASINITKWTVNTDAYSTAAQSGGTLNLFSDLAPSQASASYVGFHNYQVSGGTTPQASAIFTVVGEFRTSTPTTIQTTRTYYLQEWNTFEYSWLSSTLARFYSNNRFITDHTTCIPTVNLPVRFLARSMNSGGTHYGCWVTSVNTTIGRIGTATRMRCWVDQNYVFANARGAQIKADWVLVRQCSTNEPVATATYFPSGNNLVRRIVNINPATPVANFTIRLDLNNSFNYDRCALDGADIRFYSMANVSQAYWIEKWNDAGASTIWINVGQASTSSIQMEYGDKARISASNGNATFSFFDHFIGGTLDTTTKWTKLQEVSGAIWQDKALDVVVFDDANNGNPEWYTTPNGLVLASQNNIGTSFVVNAKMKFSDSCVRSAFGLDTLTDNSNALANYFRNDAGAGKIYQASDIIGGTFTYHTGSSYIYNTSAWYVYQISVTGTQSIGRIYTDNGLLVDSIPGVMSSKESVYI
nr:DUF2341 domain-containing protein [Candidatus Sigynarchaeota archaeon]